MRDIKFSLKPCQYGIKDTKERWLQIIAKRREECKISRTSGRSKTILSITIATMLTFVISATFATEVTFWSEVRDALLVQY